MSSDEFSVRHLTGADGEQFKLVSRSGKRAVYPERFTTVFTSCIRDLSQRDWPGNVHRILWVLVDHLDPVAWKLISQADLARAVGVSQPTAQRALSTLIAANYIQRDTSIKTHRYRLNMEFFWRARAANWYGEMRARQKL